MHPLVVRDNVPRHHRVQARVSPRSVSPLLGACRGQEKGKAMQLVMNFQRTLHEMPGTLQFMLRSPLRLPAEQAVARSAAVTD